MEKGMRREAVYAPVLRVYSIPPPSAKLFLFFSSLSRVTSYWDIDWEFMS